MEARVRLVGNVGSDVEYRKPTETMGAWATFRVAVTPGYRGQDGAWVPQATVWLSVNCRGRLAYHVQRSLKSGDAVVVVGNLRTNTWVDKDGQQREQVQVQATLVGHDLNKGTAGFARSASDNPSRAGADPWTPHAHGDGPGDPATGEIRPDGDAGAEPGLDAGDDLDEGTDAADDRELVGGGVG